MKVWIVKVSQDPGGEFFFSKNPSPDQIIKILKEDQQTYGEYWSKFLQNVIDFQLWEIEEVDVNEI